MNDYEFLVRENNHLQVKLGFAEERVAQLLNQREELLKEIRFLKDDLERQNKAAELRNEQEAWAHLAAFILCQ